MNGGFRSGVNRPQCGESVEGRSAFDRRPWRAAHGSALGPRPRLPRGAWRLARGTPLLPVTTQKKSILAVARSYIAPAMTTFLASASSVITGLISRNFLIVSSTFVRATASTNFGSLLVRAPE